MLVALLAAVLINHVGVRIGIRAIVTAAALSLIPFLIIAVAIVARGGAAGNTLAV